jgi:hypothetical protein
MRVRASHRPVWSLLLPAIPEAGVFFSENPAHLSQEPAQRSMQSKRQKAAFPCISSGSPPLLLRHEKLLHVVALEFFPDDEPEENRTPNFLIHLHKKVRNDLDPRHRTGRGITDGREPDQSLRLPDFRDAGSCRSGFKFIRPSGTEWRFFRRISDKGKCRILRF